MRGRGESVQTVRLEEAQQDSPTVYRRLESSRGRAGAEPLVGSNSPAVSRDTGTVGTTVVPGWVLGGQTYSGVRVDPRRTDLSPGRGGGE